MYDRESTTIKVTHHDEIMWPFPRDITGLFALTKYQWELEKAGTCAVEVRVEDRVEAFYLAPSCLNPEILGGGYSEREMPSLLRERWGIDSVLDTKCKYPIIEGIPIGDEVDMEKLEIASHQQI